MLEPEFGFYQGSNAIFEINIAGKAHWHLFRLWKPNQFNLFFFQNVGAEIGTCQKSDGIVEISGSVHSYFDTLFDTCSFKISMCVPLAPPPLFRREKIFTAKMLRNLEVYGTHLLLFIDLSVHIKNYRGGGGALRRMPRQFLWFTCVISTLIWFHCVFF